MTASMPRHHFKTETLLRLHRRLNTATTKRKLLIRIQTLDACLQMIADGDEKGALKLMRSIVQAK